MAVFQRMKANLLRLSLLAAAAAIVLPFVSAGETNDIDRTDPNFVKASLMIMSRGEVLFSCAGHTCLRLECPTHKLDYCFSYESENIGDRIFSFFCGSLKMGLFAVPTKDFLEQYRKEGRGAVQYPLNLPPEVKVRLWKILDDKAAEGPNLPYEYLKNGCCVQAVYKLLHQAIVPLVIDSSLAKELPYASIREVFSAEVTPTHPWSMFMLHAICGTAVDHELTKTGKLVVPEDLATFLQHSRVAGQIIAGEREELVPVTVHVERSFFSPLRLAWMLVALAILNVFWRRRIGDWAFLLAQSVAGAFFMYLVCFSNLPGTTWNWLIVPFNLFPLVFWHWRRYWAWAFAAVLLAWEAFMALWPHRLTDPAYLVIVLAYIVFYVKVAWRKRKGAFPILV